MTLRTVLGEGKANSSPATYYLIKWPEEDTHSIVPKAKVSTPVEELATGAMCKVKGFEKFLSQIVAEGTREEMNKKLDDIVGEEGDKENEPPARKRKRKNLEDGPSTKKARTVNKPPPKNQIKTPSRQKKGGKKVGSILLVTSGPSTESNAPGSSSPKPTTSSPHSSLESTSPPPIPPKPTKPPPIPPKPTNPPTLVPSSPKPAHSLRLTVPDIPPPAVMQPLVPPSTSAFDQLEIPLPDLQWYESSPAIQGATSKKPPELSAVTPKPSSASIDLDLISSSDDSQDALRLSLTVDDHENRLGLVEQEFTKMKATIQQLLQKVTQLERALQQPSGGASQQQAPVAAAQPVYNSSSLPIIPQAASATRLPSSVINKSKLQPVARIIKNNSDLVGKDGRVTTLALILARECFFGEDVMIQCTPQGGADKPGLPYAELMQLKEEIRKTFPQYWNAPQEIEWLWTRCLASIGQACKRLRSNLKSKQKPMPSIPTANAGTPNTIESLV